MGIDGFLSVQADDGLRIAFWTTLGGGGLTSTGNQSHTPVAEEMQSKKKHQYGNIFVDVF